ncbi:hypothetical protein [Persephonella sp. KM09-Lau-8]|uniref:hypothetical protein n=1 Tax=Persephonella sp. KM09-Lau-8 TaxID=1158345 RepID=UPI0004972E7E|nr:hypothetical protein [Persephonella sp. KM09-Lau-8]
MVKKEFLITQINKALKKHNCKTFVEVSLDIKNTNKLIISIFDKTKIKCVENAIKTEFPETKFEIKII